MFFQCWQRERISDCPFKENTAGSEKKKNSLFNRNVRKQRQTACEQFLNSTDSIKSHTVWIRLPQHQKDLGMTCPCCHGDQCFTYTAFVGYKRNWDHCSAFRSEMRRNHIIRMITRRHSHQIVCSLYTEHKPLLLSIDRTCFSHMQQIENLYDDIYIYPYIYIYTQHTIQYMWEIFVWQYQGSRFGSTCLHIAHICFNFSHFTRGATNRDFWV